MLEDADDRSKGDSSFTTYRLSVTVVSIIFEEFRQHWLIECSRCNRGVSFKMMEAFLSYMSSGRYYGQVARSDDISKPTMIMYRGKVSSFFSSIASHHIRLPSSKEIEGRQREGYPDK